jgi:hypothetical protein
LSDFYPDYADRYPSTYAVDRVLNALEQERVAVPSGFDLPAGIDNGAKTFVGYLMFDSVISNCEAQARRQVVRHDQNFEIQVLPDGTQELAPTFDQGQAMGATLSDKMRETFTTQDYQEYLEGSFYQESNSENILTSTAFEIAANRYPEAAAIWQERLARIAPERIDEIFDRIPEDRISPIAAKFAKQVIEDVRERVLSLDLSPAKTTAAPEEFYQPNRGELLRWYGSTGAAGDLALQQIALDAGKRLAAEFKATGGEGEVPSRDYSSPNVVVSADLREKMESIVNQQHITVTPKIEVRVRTEPAETKTIDRGR